MKKVKILVTSVLFYAMGYVGYMAHEKMTMTEAEKFMLVNIEALTRDESGGSSEIVKCYCTKKLFGTNVCTTGANGSYCGGDPCSNHDGNCRR
ncbi:MAG: hypothetical protein ACLTSL_00995 [Odoribacter splanchnicus]